MQKSEVSVRPNSKRECVKKHKRSFKKEEEVASFVIYW